MIYIIDDTINQRRESISYLSETPYSEICRIIEFPSIEINKEIVTMFSEGSSHLLFIHRSAIYYNNELKPLDNSENLRNNLINQIKQKGIDCYVFSRDVSNNKDMCYINKDLLYRNLRLFLDQWFNGTRETDILYEGPRYRIASRKKLLNEIISIVNEEYPVCENPKLEDAVRQYFPTCNPKDIVNLWLHMKLTKKEIRQYLNDKL